MKIVHIATEFAPIAKAGGLGEVVTGLSREQLLLHEDVEVFLPKYDLLDLKKIKRPQLEIADFRCFEKGFSIPNALWKSFYEEIPLQLIEVRHPSGYFHRNKIYGCDDDIARFLYFTKAVFEVLQLRNEKIDVLHLHDWHTAIGAILAKNLFKIPIRAIVLTIHNGAYQGRCATWDLDNIGLDGKSFLTQEKMKDDVYPETINLLKGGILYSDWVATVSPTYRNELLTSQEKDSLGPIYRKKQNHFTGILNGLDLSLWKTGFQDPLNLANIQHVKKKARQELSQKIPIAKENGPIIGAITRIAEQKGPELIEEALKETVRQKGIFVLLGSSATKSLQDHFEKLKKEYEKSQRAFLFLHYDENLAHLLYRAIDFLVLPSRYEPCGLSQMIAMHHATIPIARKTGGHIDTIHDGIDGFLFSEYSQEAMRKEIERAILFFRNEKALYEKMQMKASSIDWSWKKAALQYQEIYSKAFLI